jgi:hypothetical protein
MKAVVSTDQYTIYRKRNDRYAVRDAARAWVNGESKTMILAEHGLITLAAAKAPPPAEAPAAEAPAGETPAGETPAAETETPAQD